MSRTALTPAELQGLARRAITQLNNVIRMLRIHEPTNPSVTSLIESLAISLGALSEHFGAAARIEVVSGSVFINEIRVRVTAASAAQVQVLGEEFDAWGFGGFAVERPVRVEALRGFLAAFSRCPASAEERGRAQRQLVAIGRDFGMELLESRALVSAAEAAEAARESKHAAVDIFARLVVTFDAFLIALEDGQDPLHGRLEMVRLCQELVDLSDERIDFLLALPLLRRTNQAALDRAAPRYASVHAAQTAVWAVLIGRVLELNRLSLLDLAQSALLGDVGFALLPESMTQAEGVLAQDQLQELQRAMTRATGALLGAGRVDDTMTRHLIVAYEHHGPYSDPRSGQLQDQHVLSRITAVACAFDAMTSPRPWRPAMTQHEALEVLLQEAGTRFDPRVVHALLNLMVTFAGAVTFGRTD
jgi:HD-GYP domain-containing protein (c-di-GMP phosphodiesterase class II)